MRYVRMYIGSEDGEPGITLYEIDSMGWVHRQVQIHADGLRFSPEDILMRQPVNAEYMMLHPAAEEIARDDFETLWEEVDEGREFRKRVPDTEHTWQGTMEHPMGQLVVRWTPGGAAAEAGWTRVPGFQELFVWGDAQASWAAYGAVFLETEVEWQPLELRHAA